MNQEMTFLSPKRIDSSKVMTLQTRKKLDLGKLSIYLLEQNTV